MPETCGYMQCHNEKDKYRMKRIKVSAGCNKYPVYIDKNICGYIGNFISSNYPEFSKIVIITLDIPAI